MRIRLDRLAWRGVFLAALMAGCSQMPVEDIRETNAANLRKLAPGMSRQEVTAIMGTGTETVREGVYHEQRLIGYVDLDVANPYRSETLQIEGDRFDVLYYYAWPGGMRMGPWDTNYADRRVLDWFLTPVLLKNGEFVGLGEDTMLREGLIEPPAVPDEDMSIYVGS